MTTTMAFVAGAGLLGWLLPEFLLLLSPTDRFKTTPAVMNVYASVGCALIAYGLRG